MLNKLIITLSIIFICTSSSYAINEEVIQLGHFKKETLTIPETTINYKYTINEQGEAYNNIDENYENEDVNDVIFENKIGQNFEKFLNNKIVNKKLNIFSINLGKEN